MSEVKVGKNESLDSALRRFKRSCQKIRGYARYTKA
jgi:small subunit ribosomal protein S21